MNRRYFVYTIFVLILLSSCSVQRGGNLVERIRNGYYPYHVKRYVKPGYVEYGTASWYGYKFHGKRTADGEIYNMYAMTAAHKTLPFNTYVKVINLNNHRQAVVRINDRGPFVNNRIIDLSYAAAKKLGMIGTGTAPVKLIVLASNGQDYSSAVTDSPKETTNTDTDLTEGDIDTSLNLDTDIYDSSSHFAYYIQIGSFKVLANALRLRDKASKLIGGVHIIKVKILGDVFYRVVIGSFASKNAAFAYAKRNVEDKFGNFCIIGK